MRSILFAPSRPLRSALVLVGALPALVSACVAPQASSDRIAAAVQPFVDSHKIAGAVMLVANKDRVLELSAVGYADIATNKPMSTDSLFWIASQSKPITATAFMMLVDEGKVNLDDPVAKYLPEFNNVLLKTEADGNHIVLKRPQHAITVREILSHTSGLPFLSPIENQLSLDLMPLSAAIVSYTMNPLDFEPGTKYQYSNEGIDTAGRIIEVVSGMSYEKFLNERLIKPLGMKDTTFVPTKRQVGRLAKSYGPNAKKDGLEQTSVTYLRYPLDDSSRYPEPAGGLFSTATDLARFCQMILNGGVYGGKRYISEASIHEMTRKQTSASIPDSYGLGWFAGESFGHGGAYSTNFTIDPKNGLIFVWMIQHVGWQAESFDAFLKASYDRFGKH